MGNLAEKIVNNLEMKELGNIKKFNDLGKI